MGRGTYRGWAYRGDRVEGITLPLAEEATIDVRWPGGGFSVHGSPWDLEAFATGHLVSEGYVTSFEGVRSVVFRPLREDHFRVDVELRHSGRARGVRHDNVIWGPDSRAALKSRRGTKTNVRPRDLLALAKSLHNQEEALRGAGPLHWAALYDPPKDGMLLASDLSRHSAVDKVLGKALLSGLPVAGRILYSTGRIGEEMTAKAIRMGVGALATRSVPFLGAVELAERHGLVLVGKLHPGGFWVYAGKKRLGRAGDG